MSALGCGPPPASPVGARDAPALGGWENDDSDAGLLDQQFLADKHVGGAERGGQTQGLAAAAEGSAPLASGSNPS